MIESAPLPEDLMVEESVRKIPRLNPIVDKLLPPPVPVTETLPLIAEVMLAVELTFTP